MIDHIEDVEQVEEVKTVRLSDFLKEWDSILKREVIRNMKPIYNPHREDEWDAVAREKLGELLRPPFASQISRGILPVARHLYKEDKKAVFLVGEMGTGKTFMGIAAAHLLPQKNKRILIQCPGHLVKKWIREVRQTIPGAVCIDMNGKSMEKLIQLKTSRNFKPQGVEVWVIGKERAKLHYQRTPQLAKRQHSACCPDCGARIEETGVARLHVCEECGGRLVGANNKKFRRYAKAEFVKRFFPKNFFDLLLLDEVHELKGGGTAQGQAMSCFIARSKKIVALTGTIMGGYSKDLYYLLWRLFPREMVQSGFEYGRSLQFAERYGVLKRVYDSKDVQFDLNQASIGKKMGRSKVKEAPGISPLLLPNMMLGCSTFVRLGDISDALPSYDEIIVPVTMLEEQKQEYEQLADKLINATREALAKGDMRLMGKMINSLLAYPDGCRKEEIVTLERDGVLETIATANALDINLLPKERRLLEILATEKKQGRKAAIFLEHTGTRDLIPVLQAKLEEYGFSPLVLRSNTVKSEKREEWLKKKLETNEYDCLLCNPNLVKTGLDLLEFPSIVFFQCGYSVFTLRQASRRSWRIGQNHPVRVFYMANAGTMQEKALSLMAQKMETALAVEGELPDQGLAAFSESENSIMFELARALTGKQQTPQLSDVWNSYKQSELFTSFPLDSEPEVKTETTITATTRIKTSTGKTTSVRLEYVVRGNVVVKDNFAVANVDSHRFELKNGAIFWSGKQVGWYDRKGVGKIGKKPIKIYRPQKARNYVLAELRQKAA